MPRIIVVSNRLPVTINPDKSPPHDVKQSSGGLVSALKQVAEIYDELIWIGWPGASLDTKEEERKFTERLKQESTTISLVPVWLSQTEVEDFYNGYSNSSLWPLLHWMTPYARFKRSWADCYRQVNERFAETILEIATPKDLIWVQDYHLFMVPAMLRVREGEKLLRLEQEAMLIPQPCISSAGAARPEFLPSPGKNIGGEAASQQEAAQQTVKDLKARVTQLREAEGLAIELAGGPEAMQAMLAQAETAVEQAEAEAIGGKTLDELRPDSLPAALDEASSSTGWMAAAASSLQAAAASSAAAAASSAAPQTMRMMASEESIQFFEPQAVRIESGAGSIASDEAEASSEGFRRLASSDDIASKAQSISQIEWEVKLKIALFLHTPFPPYEVLCVLPNCVELLMGVLGADLVGFHTYGYLRHFRSCVVRLCGFTPEIDHIDHSGQRTRLGVFPIGANWQGIQEAMKTPSFEKHLEDYTKEFSDKNLVLSVERLDYTKGVPQKLAAIERYLEKAVEAKEATDALREQQDAEKAKGPEEERKPSPPGSDDGNEEVDTRQESVLLERLQEKHSLTSSPKSSAQASPDFLGGLQRIRSLGSFVKKSWRSVLEQTGAVKDAPIDHCASVFLFVAVPSRQEVAQYKDIEEEVHQIISRINGRFSTALHQPIVYIHRPIPIAELTALYARADCCLVTPLIDGMNLVAKEYIAAKVRDVPNIVPGSLVLSELAGAAQELFDAIVVNPYDEDAVADAIFAGLELTKGRHLDEALRWQLTEKMREAVVENDAVRWAETLLDSLMQPLETSVARPTETSILQLEDRAASRFFESRPGTKALFLSAILDYDGTIGEDDAVVEDVELVVPSNETAKLFEGLDSRKDLEVFIVSGRDQEFLEKHFKAYKSFTLIADGCLQYGPDTNHEWRPCNLHASNDWMKKVEPIMELFQRYTPGAEVESKTSSIVWHYRKCDEEYGAFKAKELVHQLSLSLGNLPCSISQGQHIVEVSSLQVNKGLVVLSTCRSRETEGRPFSNVLCIGDDRADENMFLDAPRNAITVKVGLGGDSYARRRLETPAEVRRFLGMVVEQKVPSTSPKPKSPAKMSEVQVVSPQPAKPIRKVSEDSEVPEWLLGRSKYHSVTSQARDPDDEDGDQGALNTSTSADDFEGLDETEMRV